MSGRLPPIVPLSGPHRHRRECWALLLAGTLGVGAAAPAAEAPVTAGVPAQFTAATVAVQEHDPDEGEVDLVRPRYVPAGDVPGIPSDAVLEKEHAVIGEVLIDNQNIFNLDDPADDHKIFRLADKLHIKTRANVVRAQ